MPTIKIQDISHVRFAAPDLARMRSFLVDFGFACSERNGRLYAHAGEGGQFVHSTELGDPGFRSLGLRADSMADLERLAAQESAVIEALDDPGGGHVVRLTDPDGFGIEVVAGQTLAPAGTGIEDVPHNTSSGRPRIRRFIRLSQGPSHIVRIGHCVLNVSDFRASEKWYKDRFGFLTSDEIEMAPGAAVGAFMRCDRGEAPTDHHTLFLAQLPQAPGFMHAAFEVSNLDDLMLGHAHLKQRGWDPAWGVGRHILGSQVFDYWRDPWGHELEHWTDGDLMTANDPANKTSFQSLLAVQWGSPHPLVARQTQT